jgi:hypothetical protein
MLRIAPSEFDVVFTGAANKSKENKRRTKSFGTADCVPTVQQSIRLIRRIRRIRFQASQMLGWAKLADPTRSNQSEKRETGDAPQDVARRRLVSIVVLRYCTTRSDF